MGTHDHGDFREVLQDEHPHSYDRHEPNYLVLGVIGTVVVVGLGLVAIGIQFYYESFFEARTYEKVLSQENWNLQELRRNEARELQTYGYEDAEKGTVRIPIEQAKRLIVKESAENRLKYPTNAYPIKPAERLETDHPAVSQPGVAAALSGQQQGGGTTSPYVQEPLRYPATRKDQ